MALAPDPEPHPRIFFCGGGAGGGYTSPAVVAGPSAEAKATEAVKPWHPKLPALPWPLELPAPPWFPESFGSSVSRYLPSFSSVFKVMSVVLFPLSGVVSNTCYVCVSCLPCVTPCVD